MEVRKERQTDQEKTARGGNLHGSAGRRLEEGERGWGGPVHEMVETMALLGPEESENMLQWYVGMITKEITPAGFAR